MYFYSNDPEEPNEEFSINFEDIIAYALKRYKFLQVFSDEIKAQEMEWNESWKNVSIPREVTPFKQLLVLKEENDKRYGNAGYMWEIEELISFFNDPLNLPVDIIHLLGSKELLHYY